MVGLEVHGNRRPLPIVAIANELLASLGTPPITQITQITLEGDFGTVA